jgi:hypothetical protein
MDSVTVYGRPRFTEPARHHTLCLRTTIKARVAEKVAYDLDVLPRLLPKCHVAARAKGDPSRLLDTVKQGRNAGIWHLIVGTIDDQRRAGDSAQFRDDGPVLEYARHVELVDSEPV